MSSQPFLGLRTAIYPVDNLEQAKSWYSRAFGTEPYFDEPFYVGFNVGGYELGLIPAEGDSQPGGSGVAAYWGVENADTALAWLLGLGAGENEAVQEVGGGIRTATVRDPFGNVLGVIENPHFRPEKP